MITQFVLNGANHDGVYSLSLFDADGYSNPFTPVVTAANSGGAIHIAWPSGMNLPDGTIRLFGHRYFNNAWSDLGVWEIPPGGGAATFKGAAITMIAGEVGIGPSTLFYVEGDARPWKNICLSRKPGGDISQAFLSSSVTGATGTWQRDGVVLTVNQPWEANACPNFVTWLPDEGKWALFSGTGVSFASSIGDMFTDKVQVMFGNGLVHDVIEGVGGPNSVRIASGSVRIGEPYCIMNPVSGSAAPMYPLKQAGDRVYFDRQLTTDYAGGKLAHFGRVAWAPKYVWRKPDGSWGGYSTCQNMCVENPSILTEYVAEISSPAIRGPWAFVKRDIVFKPWNGSNYASCENPAPILLGD